MKKVLISFFIMIISFLFLRCEDQFIFPEKSKKVNLTPSEKKVVSSTEVFGIKLFNQVNKTETEKNIFISPLSVSMALGMTLNGAAGSTYDSMKAVLELNGLTDQEINQAYKNLIDILTGLDPKVVFDIANSIWYRNTMTFQQNFINTNKTYFNAEVSGLDFSNPGSVDIINNWVNQSTNGKIPGIIQSIPPEMVMYLINAIYFKGDWKYKFDQNYTKDDLFTLLDGSKIPCKMMEQWNYYKYFSNDLFQAAELAYGDSSFSMIIFLPKTDKNINDLTEQFNSTNWNLWLNSFTLQEGGILFPKFELKYEIRLNAVLTSLGMGVAFSDFADFTRMNSLEQLFISEVKHKTYIKVDEEGTEAAAVTSVGMGTTSVGGNRSKFFMRIDRPFIFVIKDNQANSILFIGKIINPEE